MHCGIVDSREQAFVQSLSTAVLVQAVSKACSSGLSSHCGCGPVPNEPLPDHQSDQFQWGGCPDDLPHGLAFSRAFQQTPASSRKRRRASRRSLVNRHNSDVGRQVQHRPCNVLSTHADRQGADIPCTVLFACFCVCVCTVTDYSGEDKSSGVKFCTAFYQRPGQGMSHFGDLCSPRSQKSDE